MFNLSKLNPTDDYNYDIYSENGEDGILSHLFTTMKKSTHKSTYIYITSKYTRRNPILNLIKEFEFISNVSLNFYNGIVPSTMCGIQELLTTTKDGLKYNNVTLLYIDINSVDYWLLKTYMKHSQENTRPRVIGVRINYIISDPKCITVPYVHPERRNNLFDQNYQGASIGAFCKLLEPEYRFIGTTQNARIGFFVKESESVHPFDRKQSVHLNNYPNVVFGKKYRWPIVENKFWIQVT